MCVEKNLEVNIMGFKDKEKTKQHLGKEIPQKQEKNKDYHSMNDNTKDAEAQKFMVDKLKCFK